MLHNSIPFHRFIHLRYIAPFFLMILAFGAQRCSTFYAIFTPGGTRQKGYLYILHSLFSLNSKTQVRLSYFPAGNPTFSRQDVRSIHTAKRPLLHYARKAGAYWGSMGVSHRPNSLDAAAGSANTTTSTTGDSYILIILLSFYSYLDVPKYYRFDIFILFYISVPDVMVFKNLLFQLRILRKHIVVPAYAIKNHTKTVFCQPILPDKRATP